MNNWNNLFQHFETFLHQDFKNCTVRQIGGGCINQTFLLENTKQRYFLKLNYAHAESVFLAETEGLKEIAQTKTILVPEPLLTGKVDNLVFLLMRYFDSGHPNKKSHYKLGEQLATMHQVYAPQFGWKMDNFIGLTPQENNWKNDWIDFWRKHRLAFQLNLAAHNGYRGILQQGEKLLEQLPKFFKHYQPKASLLHGDLWSGNYAITTQGEPIIFDPAVYFGDRETDLAMTELFGGFSADFYAGYQNLYPLDKDYPYRKNLYNLYHILNHLNLFGSGYLKRAQHMIEQLLFD